MVDQRFIELVNHLWRAGKYSYLWTDNDGQGEKLSWWLTLPLPANFDVPKLFLNTNAYFSVNPAIMRKSQHERAYNTDVIAVNVFYCEFDCPDEAARIEARKKIDSWKTPPSCVVDSGGGLHVYLWLKTTQVLDTPEKHKRFSDLQWAFAQYAGGDTSVNDLARILRIPGTTNHKSKYAPNFPRVSIVEWQPQRQYEIADFEQLLQPYIDKRDARVYARPIKTNTSLAVDDDKLLKVLFRSKNGMTYERLWHGDLSDVNGDQSVGDQLLCDGLAWVTARDIARMDQLFRKSGLMRDKWNRDDYRKATLENAANSAYMEYDPFRGIDPQAIAAVEAMMSNE